MMKRYTLLIGIGASLATTVYAQSSGTDTGTATAPQGDQAAIDTCKTTFRTAMQSEPKPTAWDSGADGGALFHFHDALWDFNVGDLADAEQVFCELSNAWQIGTSITALPQTISKVGPDGNTVELDMTAPTEDFATTNGYTVKATMSFNGTQFMAMWWTGTGAATKGYLIQGQNPLQSDGNSRLKYAQWDLTTSSQKVAVYAAQFVTASGFLTMATNSGSAGGQVGVEYGKGTFNTTTKEIQAESLRIHPAQGGGTTFACQKDWFDGTIDASVDAYHVTNTAPYSGALPVDDDNTDNSHMEGTAGVMDAVTTTTGGTPGNAPTKVTFDYSCKALDTANAAGSPFASGAVSFTADPTTIFPN